MIKIESRYQTPHQQKPKTCFFKLCQYSANERLIVGSSGRLAQKQWHGPRLRRAFVDCSSAICTYHFTWLNMFDLDLTTSPFSPFPQFVIYYCFITDYLFIYCSVKCIRTLLCKCVSTQPQLRYLTWCFNYIRGLSRTSHPIRHYYFVV